MELDSTGRLQACMAIHFLFVLLNLMAYLCKAQFRKKMHFTKPDLCSNVMQ